MSEEERRDLIARQRSALYGEGATYAENGGFVDESGTPRPGTQGSSTQLSAGRGHSPLTFESGGGSEQSQSQQGSSQQQGQQRSRANSTSSPSSNPTNFSLFDNAAQQSSRTSTSSPGGSPPRQGGKAAPGSSVAPIGTRPSVAQGQASNPALNKRSTTPLPSPLSYGFAANEESNGNNSSNSADRATSAASNPSSTQDVGLGWGSKSGVWGKNPLGVQASVWG